MKCKIVGIKKGRYIGPYCPHPITYCCLKDFSEKDIIEYSSCEGQDVVYIYAEKDWGLLAGDTVDFRLEEDTSKKGVFRLKVTDVEMIERP